MRQLKRIEGINSSSWKRCIYFVHSIVDVIKSCMHWNSKDLKFDQMKEMNEIEKATTSSLEEQEDGTKDDKESKKVEGNMDKKKVPFYKMFSFADSIDKTLMIIGSIGAIANGVAMPLMAILLGDFLDAFGQNQNSKQIVHVVSKVFTHLF